SPTVPRSAARTREATLRGAAPAPLRAAPAGAAGGRGRGAPGASAATPPPTGSSPVGGGAGSLGDLCGRSLAGLQHLIDQPVLERGLRGEDLVALDVLARLLLGAAGVVGEGLLEPFAHAHDLVRLDLQVGGLPNARILIHQPAMGGEEH